jgi:phosphoribosyl-AMP cyclohydrolase
VQEPENTTGSTPAQVAGLGEVAFDPKGLVPCIVQEWNTGEVLMLAYMNQESLRKTLETGTTWFYSRSRGKLWNKGETSGNFQKVREVRYDCDGDTLLALVEQKGPACHTGTSSCFDDRWLGSPAGAPPAFLAQRER